MLKGKTLAIYACLRQAQQILDFNVKSIEKEENILVHFEDDIDNIKEFLDKTLNILKIGTY